MTVMLLKSKSHLALIALGTILSVFSLGCILVFTDPYTTGFITHLFFYLSLFMVLLGAFTLIGIAVRLKYLPSLYINILGTSFRQAVFISLLTTLSLFLQAKGLLFWWVAVTLILFFISLEVFINTK